MDRQKLSVVKKKTPRHRDELGCRCSCLYETTFVVLIDYFSLNGLRVWMDDLNSSNKDSHIMELTKAASNEAQELERFWGLAKLIWIGWIRVYCWSYEIQPGSPSFIFWNSLVPLGWTLISKRSKRNIQNWCSLWMTIVRFKERNLLIRGASWMLGHCIQSFKCMRTWRWRCRAT